MKSGRLRLEVVAAGMVIAGLLAGCGKAPAPPAEKESDIVTPPAKVAEVPAKAPAVEAAARRVRRAPAEPDVPARPGFEPLFKPDLSDATCRKGSWVFEDGILTPTGGGDIWTKRRYGDFVLDLEFRCEPKTNSGVFLRCKNIRQWLHTAIEVQILQPVGGNPKHSCGAIFDCLAPAKQMIKEPGEWNRYEIIAKGGTIYVILNGQRVIDMNLDLWSEPHKNPDGTRNKFKYAYRDMSREGHIGLQYHGHPVWFRNLRIRPLK
ncbi:MAG: 3-keto-disaccharide hydrolase [Planctomycetota bacterium]